MMFLIDRTSYNCGYLPTYSTYLPPAQNDGLHDKHVVSTISSQLDV